MFKESFNRLTWLCFTLIYCIYWVLEKLSIPNPTDQHFLSFLKNLGLASVLIAVIGIIVETLFVVIDLLVWVGEILFIKIKKCLALREANKVIPTPEEDIKEVKMQRSARKGNWKVEDC